MADMEEIKGLVEQINKTLVPLRTEVDALKSRDVVDESKLTRMADDVTAKMQKIMDAQAKELADLKAATIRGGAKGSDEAEARKTFDTFLRKGDQREIEIKAMATDTGASGGFLVMPEFSATIVSRVFETSPLRLVANIEQTGGKSRTFLIDDDEGSASWVGEKSTATEDTPDLGQKEIVAHGVKAQMKATQDVLDDAYIDLPNWLITKGGDKIGRTENTAFFTGNGVNKPRGLLTYAAWASAGVYERDKIEQVVSGGATSITADGIISVQAALKEAYQASAVWMMQRATFGAVLKLKGSDQFYFGPMMLKDGVPTMQLLGRRVIFADDMQANGSASNLVMAYGDFGRAYTILDRVGLTVLRDPYSATPYTTFHLTKRTGGDVTNFDAIKLMKLST